MKISELRIHAFGKLEEKKISFGAGMNGINGLNGAGKTTIAKFILAMLYGLPENSADYQHYNPRGTTGVYGGEMEVHYGKGKYRIVRSFLKNAPELRITDCETNEEIENPEEWMEELCGHLPKEEYEKGGFILADAFIDDRLLYQLTPEKKMLLAKKEALQKEYREAREYLLTKRKKWEDKKNNTNLSEEQKKCKTEINAIDIAIGSFEKLGELNGNEEEILVSDIATDYFSKFYPEKNVAVLYENGIVHVLQDGEKYTVTEISTGMLHLLSLAMRLTRMQIEDYGRDLPIIADDTFAGVDGIHTENALKVLRDTKRQVISLSPKMD